MLETLCVDPLYPWSLVPYCWGSIGCLDLGNTAFVISAHSLQYLSPTRSPASAFKWPYRSYTANCPSFVSISAMLWLATWVAAIPQQMAGMVSTSGSSYVVKAMWNGRGDVGILDEVGWGLLVVFSLSLAHYCYFCGTGRAPDSWSRCCACWSPQGSRACLKITSTGSCRPWLHIPLPTSLFSVYWMLSLPLS